MGTARLNITLPEELLVELDQVVGPRRKSQFIASTIRDRLKKISAERLRDLLAEGYRARNKESFELTREFEAVDLEGWDEY